MNSQSPIMLYTDGACSGNPGAGGYGIVLKWGSLCKELSEGFAETTNNRMELLAVIKGLEAIKWEKAQVIVTSDSSYVVKAINEGWLKKWRANDFISKSGSKKTKVKNIDLWTRLIPLLEKHQVSFVWVKGHNAHPENERCDQLAVNAYKEGPLQIDKGYIDNKE